MKRLLLVFLAEINEAVLIFTVAALKGAGVTAGVFVMVMSAIALMNTFN